MTRHQRFWELWEKMDDGWVCRLSGTYAGLFGAYVQMKEAGCVVELRPQERERLRREAQRRA